MYDVAVIGAGLAGLQTARLLAARGAKVVLIDRRASVCERIHTTGIFVRKTWEDFPILAEQLGPAIRRVTLYSPARRRLELEAEQPEFRVGRMQWVYLRLLDECGRRGVTWMPATHFVAIDDGIVVERRGHREKIEARFVVGADGARSLVAPQLGLDRNFEFLAGVEEVFPSASTSEPSLQCYIDPRLAPGYIAWIVDDGEESHVGVAGYGDRYRPNEALDAFKRELGITRKPAERRGGLIPVNGILQNIGNARGLLVGDAAGAVSPLTAGGLDAAMRLSAFAAECIVSAAHDDYSGGRFRARFAARRFMRRAMHAIDHPLVAEAACALLRMPPLRAVAEHVFFARNSFPDVRWTLPASVDNVAKG